MNIITKGGIFTPSEEGVCAITTHPPVSATAPSVTPATAAPMTTPPPVSAWGRGPPKVERWDHPRQDGWSYQGKGKGNVGKGWDTPPPAQQTTQGGKGNMPPGVTSAFPRPPPREPCWGCGSGQYHWRDECPVDPRCNHCKGYGHTTQQCTGGPMQPRPPTPPTRPGTGMATTGNSPAAGVTTTANQRSSSPTPYQGKGSDLPRDMSFGAGKGKGAGKGPPQMGKGGKGPQ